MYCFKEGVVFIWGWIFMVDYEELFYNWESFIYWIGFWKMVNFIMGGGVRVMNVCDFLCKLEILEEVFLLM